MATYTTLKDLRWTKREVALIVSEMRLDNVQMGNDSRGYYIKSCDAEQDPLPAVFSKLRKDLREQRKAARNVRGGRVTGTTSPVRRHITGVCARVREWAGEHPQASVQDAVAAFPEANKTTVRIQFKKAHG